MGRREGGGGNGRFHSCHETDDASASASRPPVRHDRRRLITHLHSHTLTHTHTHTHTYTHTHTHDGWVNTGPTLLTNEPVNRSLLPVGPGRPEEVGGGRGWRQGVGGGGGGGGGGGDRTSALRQNLSRNMEVLESGVDFKESHFYWIGWKAT